MNKPFGVAILALILLGASFSGESDTSQNKTPAQELLPIGTQVGENLVAALSDEKGGKGEPGISTDCPCCPETVSGYPLIFCTQPTYYRIDCRYFTGSGTFIGHVCNFFRIGEEQPATPLKMDVVQPGD